MDDQVQNLGTQIAIADRGRQSLCRAALSTFAIGLARNAPRFCSQAA